MMDKIDHLGIAVADLQAQIPLYRDQFGMAFEGIEEIPSQMVRVAFFQVGQNRIELLEPTAPESPIAQHIQRRGPGIHHVAYTVANVRAAMAEARSRGLQPLSEEPRPGAHHTLVCFLHPKSAGGVLVELVEHPKA